MTIDVASRRIRRVARGEFHRKLRSIRETPREAIAILLIGFVVFLFALGGTVGAYLLGQSLRTGSSVPEIPLLSGARATVGSVWLVLIVAIAFRTVAKVGSLEPRELLLPTVPVRDLVFGKILAEAMGLACWFALPVGAVSVAFAVGARDPTAPLVFAPIAAVLAACAIGIGFVIGLAIKHLATRYEPIVRVKTPLAIVLTVGYVALVVTGHLGSVFVVLYEPFQYWPVSWLADALFVCVSVPVAGVDATVGTAVAGIGFTSFVAVGAFALAPTVAEYHWLSDRPRIDRRSSWVRSILTRSKASASTTSTSSVGSNAPSSSSGGTNSSTNPQLESRARSAVETGLLSRVATANEWLISRIESVVGPETRAVATVVWRRTVRSPVRLIYLLYPLFFAIEPFRLTFESLRATGTVPASVPPLVMTYAVWAAGMAFTLNALGDQAATLQTTLTVPGSARATVRGRVLVAVATCLPLSIVLVGALSFASPLSTGAVAVFVLATAAGVVAASALATGIGVAFPRFGAVSMTRNRRVVVPGKAAAAIYSLATLVIAGCLSLVAYEPAWEPIAAVVSVLLSLATPLNPDVSVAALRAVAGLLSLGLAVVPLFSYRYAVRRIETYALE